MDEALIGALGGVVVSVLTALLGRESLGKWLLSGQMRETTAQTAIIELAREAIGGWREESTAVVRLTDMVQGHDRGTAGQYEDLRDRSARQEKRLEELGDKLATLITILAQQREVD